jgi:hypothetical protein
MKERRVDCLGKAGGRLLGESEGWIAGMKESRSVLDSGLLALVLLGIAPQVSRGEKFREHIHGLFQCNP